jgi:hypothetical protein
MSVVKFSDIGKHFNHVISDFMSKGYMISPYTGNGSYNGGRILTDMINPNDTSHIVRIWVVDKREQLGGSWWKYVDVTGVCARKYYFHKGFNGDLFTEQNLQPYYGDIVYEKYFYQFKIDKHSRKVYSDDFEEAKKLFNIHSERIINMPVDNPFNYGRKAPIDKLPAVFIDRIMKRINSVRGFKRATASCIDNVSIYKWNRRLEAKVEYSFNNKTGNIILK